MDPKNLIDAPAIVGSKPVAPILFEGSSLLLDPENPLVLEILTAPSSSYSYNPEKPITDVSSCDFVLITVLWMI